MVRRWFGGGEAGGAALPMSEVAVDLPETPAGWAALVDPLADIINRGDVPTEIDSAKVAIMHLKSRDPAQFGTILAQVAKRGVIGSLLGRIRTLVPAEMPPKSIWWRELCSVRISDCQILSIFCHSLELIDAVRPHRASIFGAMRDLLSAPMFALIPRLRRICLETILSLVILAPDFATFTALRDANLLPLLLELLGASPETDPERGEWVVYDLGSAPLPLFAESVCIHIFAFLLSECNVAVRESRAVPQAKALLGELESMAIFGKAIDAIRKHAESAAAFTIANSIKHLAIIFIFGGRLQCVRAENCIWTDETASFLASLPDRLRSEAISGEESTEFVDQIESDCRFLLTIIRERHEPSKIVNRARIPDLRQRYREAISGPRSSCSATIPGNVATCKVCGTSAVPLKKCQRCLGVLYCSRTCQVSDWKQHKPQCNTKSS